MRQFIVLAILLVALPLSPSAVQVVHAAGTVTDCTNFGSGAGTLQDALAGGGLVDFACSGTIIVPLIVLAADTQIDASGQAVTLSGNNANGVLNVPVGRTLTLVNITIADGSGAFASGIGNRGTTHLIDTTVTGNNASNAGGGILNSTGGVMTLTNSTVSGNTAVNAGAGIFNTGGVSGPGILTLTNSTVSGNTVTRPIGGSGGGIFSQFAILTLINSTVSDNSANFDGGIFTGATGAVAMLTNSTVSGNTSTNRGAITVGGGSLTLINSTVSDNSAPGGIFNQPGVVVLTNSIIADQAAGPDCANFSVIISNGHNLDSDGTCNLVDVTDIPSGNAGLQPLAVNNPGDTATHALNHSSDAIDNIPVSTNGCGTTIATDQRGVSRPQGAGCDIGAYEVFTLGGGPPFDPGPPDTPGPPFDLPPRGRP